MAPPTRNNSRAQENQIPPEHAKKDYLIARLRVKIASLERLIPVLHHAPRAKSNVTCYACGVTGHYSNKCPMKAANNAPRTEAMLYPSHKQARQRPGPDVHKHHLTSLVQPIPTLVGEDAEGRRNSLAPLDAARVARASVDISRARVASPRTPPLDPLLRIEPRRRTLNPRQAPVSPRAPSPTTSSPLSRNPARTSRRHRTVPHLAR
ncbi:hypothetical protein QYE76_046451 [Lolium multiflorum]|uniref:CCHC-type domain-containing protein n=1 Tax=Lolium multiflorum TaxID=4521 RepID=A0AAD8TPJ4_LOLMU|nr:hypothetical protein QYE76_046451 [Lolium multiflorum]